MVAKKAKGLGMGEMFGFHSHLWCLLAALAKMQLSNFTSKQGVVAFAGLCRRLDERNNVKHLVPGI